MIRFLFSLNFIIYKYLRSRGTSDETTAIVAVPFFVVLNLLSCLNIFSAFSNINAVGWLINRYIVIFIIVLLAILNYSLVYKGGKYFEIFRNISINKMDYQSTLKSSRFYMLFTFFGFLFSLLLVFILRW